MDDASPKLGEQITYLLVFMFIELRDRSEVVLLMESEHLAFTAGRLSAI